MKNVLASLVLTSMIGIGLTGCLGSNPEEESVAENDQALTGVTLTPGSLGDCEYIGGYMVCDEPSDGWTPTTTAVQCGPNVGDICVSPTHCKLIDNNSARQCRTSDFDCYICKMDNVLDHGQMYASCPEKTRQLCPTTTTNKN